MMKLEQNTRHSKTEFQPVPRKIPRKESRRILNTFLPRVRFARLICFQRCGIIAFLMVLPYSLSQLQKSFWRFNLEAWMSRGFGGVGLVQVEGHVNLLSGRADIKPDIRIRRPILNFQVSHSHQANVPACSLGTALGVKPSVPP